MTYLSFTITTAAAVALATSLVPASHDGRLLDAVSYPGRPDTLVVHPAASSIRWQGANLGGAGQVEGTVRLARGEIVIRHGELTSATFAVDMRTLQPAEKPVEPAALRRTLRDGLRGAELFDVERYPAATFAASGAKRTGLARYEITGDLTLHGVTRPITFSADVSWPEVGHMIATTDVSIDRGRWGIAGRGAQPAGDSIQLSLTIDARRRGAVVAER